MRRSTSIIDPAGAAPATLMWVGDRSSDAFATAFAYCESHAPQLAYRKDAAQAVQRQAGNVGRVVFVRTGRSATDSIDIRQLANTYPQAELLQLLGPAAAGCRETNSSLAQVCDWHQWNQHLPLWLTCDPHQTSDPHQTKSSVKRGGEFALKPPSDSPTVAVVANSYSNADPMMDLLVSWGASAVWCPAGGALSVRGVQAVWWDDSAASAAPRSKWQRRLGSWRGDNNCQHFWFTHSPGVEAVTQAEAAGVRLVVSKPFLIDALRSTFFSALGDSAPASRPRDGQRTRAA